MVIINLKRYYPDYYQEDTYIEVEEKVEDFLEKNRPKSASAKRKAYRYKAQYSLDAGDGIEEETMIRLFHEAEQNRQLEELVEQAMRASLTQTQYRRVHLRFREGKTYKIIADQEGVGISTVESTIKGAFKKLRKYFCKHSVN